MNHGPERKATNVDLEWPGAIERRRFLQGLSGAIAALAAPALFAKHPVTSIALPFDNGKRLLSDGFEGKGSMIVQRSRPPVLETPFEVFDRGLLTPNSQHYVRWHLSGLPRVDPSQYRLGVTGSVQRALSLSLDELRRDFEAHELIAISQCAGNSRGFSAPRVAGTQWGHGAMANALWRGVRLGDVLRRAGVRAGSVCVRFQGLDTSAMPATPAYQKSLPLDQVENNDILLAYEMNGAALPRLNGFPIRLVVPGWYSTYWVKALGGIEVLNRVDDSYWMTKAYLVHQGTKPDGNPRRVAISRMTPRSFVTSLAHMDKVRAGTPLAISGIAFGGDCDVASVYCRDGSEDLWRRAPIKERSGKYGFCRWTTVVRPSVGWHDFQVRTVNVKGETQPEVPLWDAAGYARNVIESIRYEAVS